MTVLQLTGMDQILHQHHTVEECSEWALPEASLPAA